MKINLRKFIHLTINMEFNNASDAIESQGYTELETHDQGDQRLNIYKNIADGTIVAYRSMENNGRFIKTITVSPEVVEVPKHGKK